MYSYGPPKYLGCFDDDYSRDFGELNVLYDPQMTVEKCISKCSQNIENKFAGLQYGFVYFSSIFF